MIDKELEHIVNKNHKLGAGPLYIRSLLKEHLQLYVLAFIYTNPNYKQSFIFTGGTCLRHFYGLERLSEDLDFDLFADFDVDILKRGILSFFNKKYFYNNIDISIHQKGKQILLKFAVLKQLGLANASESDLLYIKIDINKANQKAVGIISEAKSIQNLNFVAKHYDLPTLMANKIQAILTRSMFMGKDNRQTIKGRDYYDLLWFLKRGVTPNLDRLKALTDDESLTLRTIEQLIDDKVKILQFKFLSDFKQDLLPFVSNNIFVNDYVDNYYEEYIRNKHLRGSP